MLSKGGKIVWCCSRCNSPNIAKVGSVVQGNIMLGMYATKDDHYYCVDCGDFRWWERRIKVSIKKPMPVCRKDVGFAHLHHDHKSKQFTAYSCKNPRKTMADFYPVSCVSC